MSTQAPSYDPSYRHLCIKLDKLAPRFMLPSQAIKVLYTPAEFYETLKSKIRKARRHVFLSTLYIGPSEHELIDVLHDALAENRTLRVSILTDALRGTREAPRPCTASLLAPLVKEFGDRVELRMYHTPNLAKLRKSLIPRRFDEGWGLQHMKLYGMDDELILSGANLSNDYFINRQDRYHLFSSAPLTGFYKAVHDAICSVTFAVHPADNASGFTLDWTSSECPNPIEYPKRYKAFTTKLIQQLSAPAPMEHCEFTEKVPQPTVVYPLLQMTPLLSPGATTNTEQPTVNLVLDLLAGLPNAAWHFTAGYFNVFDEYRQRLFTALGRGTIITASPQANGFYGSRGPSGMLPAGYTLLAKRFLKELEKLPPRNRGSMTLKEWTRGNYGTPDRWTYHAKGLWIQPDTTESHAGPSLTFVGSSNFTRRSQNLDLEATALIITADAELQAALKQEVAHLEKYASSVDKAALETPERRADLKTRISLWLCQSML
ncbi:hypothetical protein BCR37DRAFT_403199 [Protomyces lactucae-debilis]|uniref:CDP-diacylglycerol--glycerol-3-phosphate 3-phosphatidyltransferase n=1 Tax=Protomyces lactucae-debilis TaxID=2754530 RepID=A0A1Y2F983_PROLT|nr:uncharacterized protein BCR37DRAFT_403199 [Protomyces lactucae-debilis]ORY79994.1 hypothetical protein BCR37DRAFT_403199 [Protomyces lactucae-debilis]